MTNPNVFSHRTSGGGCYALLVILCVFPVMAVTSFFGDAAAGIGTGIIVAVVGLAAAVWQLIRSEYRLELGPSSVKMSVRESYVGVARPEVVTWEIPIAQLTAVKEVNTRTPSSRGGWNHGSALHFPGGHALDSTFLGGKDDPSSEYSRLVKVLKERLGDAFTVEDKV